MLTLLFAVLAPWTPVETEGTAVKVWGRSYEFASNALPVRVKSQGRDLLAGPMRIVCADAEGRPVVWQKGGSWIHESDAESATVCAWQQSPVVFANVSARVEFDGMAKVSLALVPGPDTWGPTKLGKAWLEIPLARDAATLFNYFPAPSGTFANAGAVKGTQAYPFLCHIWLGNENAGFSWFCESDEKFLTADPKRVVEVVPGEHETVLRIRLADGAFEMPRTWVFGFEATPVKQSACAFADRPTLHAPPLGAGMTIKRPETWWTAQRAFPDGRVDRRLDEARDAGVGTIVFHEDWIPVQNNPRPQADFRAIANGCHRRGMKVLVYQGYEMSPLDPAWGEMSDDALTKDADGRPISYWFRQPGQRDYCVCYASAFAETWLTRIEKAYDALGIDGFYLDGTMIASPCANERHGCGWRDASGRMHPTYPIFAVRRLVRRLYEFVDGRGGRLDAHQSEWTCPATLAFMHSYYDGEQLVRLGADRIKEMLDPAAFRAEFMGRNHGVTSEFLAYVIPGKWTYADALAMALPHGVSVRPCGFAALPEFVPLWKRLAGFGVAKAKFEPYWENGITVTPDSVKVSVYRRADGRSLYVVSNLSPDKAVEARVTDPKGPDFSLRLEPFSCQLIEK